MFEKSVSLYIFTCILNRSKEAGTQQVLCSHWLRGCRNGKNEGTRGVLRAQAAGLAAWVPYPGSVANLLSVDW